MIYIFTDLKSVVRIREGPTDTDLHHGPDRHDHALCARGRFRLLHRSSDRLGGSPPYLGVGIVLIPWSLYAFMSGDLTLGIGLTVLYSIILIVRQIMEPKVLASSVGLDPLAALLGMFVGLKLFGILGLIIGPVSLVILDAFHRAHVFRT